MTSSAHPIQKSEGSGGRLTGRGVLAWLVVFFGVIFAANGALVWFAYASWNGVETQSSYKDGSYFPREQRNAQAQAQRDWHVEAEVVRSGGGADIDVTLRDRAGHPLSGLTVTARMERPSHDREDESIVLSEGEVGKYRGRFDRLERGNWHLMLDADRGDDRLFRSLNRFDLE